jgi:hypothetical protein
MPPVQRTAETRPAPGLSFEISGRSGYLFEQRRSGGGSAGDVALASGAGEPVLAEAAGRLAAAIEAADDLAVDVDDLAGGIDAQASAGVVDDRGCPSRIEGPGRAVADRTLIPYANYPRFHSAADVERIAASSITVGTPRTKGDCNRTS